MKKILILFLLLCTSIAIMVGCSEESRPDGGDNGKIGIRGEITSIEWGRRCYLIGEGKKEEDTIYDKASVRIDSNTTIQKKDSNDKIEISDIEIGDIVEIIFTGAVAESYPVQGKAKIVRLIEEKPGT